MNFRSFGNDPPPAGGGASGGGRQPGNFPLARQLSVYSLTFDELQSTMGGIGKDFGSMNMDELLKNIWTAEEIQTTGPTSTSFGQESGAPGGAESLQRQGSLTLPRTLTQKKVDDVWRDLERESGGGGGGGGSSQPQRQRTLGEITLEEFLVKSGVVREDNNNTGFFGNFPGFGFQQTNRNNLGLMGNRIHVHEVNQSANFLPLNVNGVISSQQQLLLPKPIIPSSSTFLGSPRIRREIVRNTEPSSMNGNLVESGGGMGMMMGLGAGGVSTVAVGSPVSDRVGRSTGDTSSVSPVPYVFKRGRRCTNAVEKVVERRQRRMIKNRESAARSRARKQAYTTELEAEVAKLKEENEEIRKKQAKIFERRKNQVLEMMNMQQGGKRRCLRRTCTGPW